MNENGMTLFLVALAVSAVLCLIMWLVYSRQNPESSAQDELYNKIARRSALPSNQGISIDDVMENLKDEDMGGFYLSTPDNKGGSTP